MTTYTNGNYTQPKTLDKDEQLAGLAVTLANAAAFPMILKSAFELKILDIFSKAGEGVFVSTSEIASQIGAKNPNAPVLLDRMLRLLASHSVLTCKLQKGEGGSQRVYGPAPLCNYLASNDGQGSLGPLLVLHHDKVMMESWFHLNDYILEGGVPFKRAHGMIQFDYTGTDERFNHVFNQGMAHHTILVMKKLLDNYNGFNDVKVLVDVGGNIGVNVSMIVAKHTHIKGINYDLPHVIADAPSYPGVEHVGGNMFESIPQADAIFMKWVLHDWSDEHCVKILNKCYESLAKGGKIILVESLIPVIPEDNLESHMVFSLDCHTLVHNQGGKERSKEDFEALASKTGFSTVDVICCAYDTWVMELYKK
uniref:Inositol 4-methyltransferase n=1 Tax=Mesembryanthemum crystallinum TaxID=3544 RepID=IMT1_MESCR|nr:RecName: Full=Inositol 4-methyltransferase [Mesembryanthemum crystallinum]AAA33032.1 myo-inositol O-methyl transferase [Mesembryanthemum crystallinum]AAB05891.1 inositol methyltransferase [Mesembryanthemum crystallinum]